MPCCGCCTPTAPLGGGTRGSSSTSGGRRRGAARAFGWRPRPLRRVSAESRATARRGTGPSTLRRTRRRTRRQTCSPRSAARQPGSRSTSRRSGPGEPRRGSRRSRWATGTPTTRTRSARTRTTSASSARDRSSSASRSAPAATLCSRAAPPTRPRRCGSRCRTTASSSCGASVRSGGTTPSPRAARAPSCGTRVGPVRYSLTFRMSRAAEISRPKCRCDKPAELKWRGTGYRWCCAGHAPRGDEHTRPDAPPPRDPCGFSAESPWATAEAARLAAAEPEYARVVQPT